VPLHIHGFPVEAKLQGDYGKLARWYRNQDAILISAECLQQQLGLYMKHKVGCITVLIFQVVPWLQVQAIP